MCYSITIAVYRLSSMTPVTFNNKNTSVALVGKILYLCRLRFVLITLPSIHTFRSQYIKGFLIPVFFYCKAPFRSFRFVCFDLTVKEASEQHSLLSCFDKYLGMSCKASRKQTLKWVESTS